MNEAIKRPKRKNPILRTRAPTLPPERRSRVALGLVRAAAEGNLELQRCAACGAVQYPPREACVRCLSTELEWTAVSGQGELVSETTLRHSQELFFRERAPWRLGLVRLAEGVTVVAHLDSRCGEAPCGVTVGTALDRAGQAVLVATPAGGKTALADEPKLRDMTADPRFRKVLVTDAKSPVGQAVVRAAIDAGADRIWAGHCEPWKSPPGWPEIAGLPNTTLVPLDVTDTKSVNELAAELGFKVDIVINTSEHHRTYGLFGRAGVETARAEMETNCFGLMRLAQAFGPVMQSRGAGIRVINIFPGPIDDEWNQLLLPPKLAPAAVARAIIEALKGSVEDVYPGDIAQDWLARLRDNPKALEREIGR